MVRLIMMSLLLVASAAFADGVVKQVGDTLTYECTAPSTYADGTALPEGTPVTITAYATQSPPEKGEALVAGSGCPLEVNSSGMATGQWYAYVTASAEGRPESALSNAAPFVLAPAANVPLSAPMDLQVR